MMNRGCRKMSGVQSKRGLLLIEAIVGMVVLAVILGGIIVALRTQMLAAGRTVRRARCRLAMEGELEIMRGRTGSEISECRAKTFTPALGRPEGLGDDVSFHRTVRIGKKGRQAHVRLWATKERAGTEKEWMAVEGTIFIPREARGGKTSR